MEAILVAGGLGNRMRPLTVGHPKHLLPVGGVPFLAHQILKLARSGVSRVLLATSYHAEDFELVFGDGSTLGVELVYVTETEPLGTGGALRNVADRLDSGAADPVVVLNGDILSGHDIAAQVARHRASDAEATLHLVEVADPRAFGSVPTAADDRITAFLEKSPDPVSRQVNAGCYVFRRRVLDAIPGGRPVSVERETFPDLLRAGAYLLGHRDAAYWRDVGDPRALVRASCDLVLGVVRSPAYPHPAAERYVAETAEVADPAAVRGGSVVANGAVVGPGAMVESSVLLPGAAVATGAVVADSVLAADARVGARTVVRDGVVGERARIGTDCELLAGARVWCDAEIPDGALRFSSDV